MELLKNINLGFRFFLELCLLFALGYSGFHLASHDLMKWLLAILLPLGAALLWGVLIAPKSARQLGQPRRMVAELFLFGTAAMLLYGTGHETAGVTLAAAVLAHEALLIALKE